VEVCQKGQQTIDAGYVWQIPNHCVS